MSFYIKLATKGAVLLGFFLAAPFAYASVAQYDVSTSSATNRSNPVVGTGEACQTLGTGLSGNLSTVAVWVSFESGYTAPAGFTLDINEHPDSSYSVGASGTRVFRVTYTSAPPLTDNTVATAQIFSTSTPATLDPSKYYSLRYTLSNGDNAPWTTYGSTNVIAWPNGEATSTAIFGCPNSNNMVSNTGIEDFAFALDSNPPANWSQFASTTIYVPGLSTSTVEVYCAGNVVETGICNVFTFLFVPSDASLSSFLENKNVLIETRFPFSWLTDMREIFNEITATTTDNFINLSLDFGTTTEVLGFTDLDVISTSTISRYLSEETRTAIKTLLATVFYLLAAGFLYRNVQGFWHNQV